MSTYEIKTHRSRAERKESVQWTLLVKEPAGAIACSNYQNPCPNCFVITTTSEQTRESLFYLCLSLKMGNYFSYYLKGSVIPFICISDAKKVINVALQNYQEQQWQLKVEKLKKINAFEENLQQQLKTISKLKIALLRS
ncbi:hypothetical protein Lupro_11810 [Lutibacter profundi]|uniref:Uncharacterized protein n=1 Tax=Lutibacter profundi TaxID=1622118 RepID=A0A0X8G895_9FLAO|nr:hypothetical protein [Lutibacter profundi]AMC11908.1 hypothetical protein Lupro_11810 [Lutibacter profundi]